MNMRDAQILNARKKAIGGYYCNLQTQVHVGCEHGNSLLSTELPKPKRQTRKPRHASRAEQHARYLDCGPLAWDDRD
jgi:hypothetical protein